MNYSHRRITACAIFLSVLATSPTAFATDTTQSDSAAKEEINQPAENSDKSSTPQKPWNHWQYGNSTLEFHGYMRSSVGTDGYGHTPAMFKVPGAQDKYRLGNETDTNLETGLDYNYFLDGVNNPKSRFIQLYGMLATYTTNPYYDKFHLRPDDEGISQAYIRFGNFLGDGVNAWVGRRYYDRRYINIIDHFWLDIGQGAQLGGGLEGLNVGGPGKLDTAIFEERDKNATDQNGGPVVDGRDLYTHVLDNRYRGIPTNRDGKLTLWTQLAERRSNDQYGYGTKYGYSIGGWHEQDKLYGGNLTTALTLRKGATVVQGATNSRAVREDQGYDLNKAYALEANSNYFYEPESKDYGIEWVGLYRREDHGVNGAGGGKTVDWLSTGIRPQYALSDHFSIASNVGVDYIANDYLGRYGTMGTTSLALQFSEKKGFNDRPVARLFVTGAMWSDGLKGAVGNSPSNASFGDDQSGLTFGLQVDHFW